MAELVVARMGPLPAPIRDVVDVLALAEPLGLPLLTKLTSAEAVETPSHGAC
ncbi:hypothetical protein [Alloactinosynnema sp. L-07]|uniref:hypothetical protein n=1 Tax=Alloactinosynnema sp. L-07 TaxID=1653480 RepID=UPI0012FA83A5|nr:hypothetical protein [Alloactinosynnema sp. L-07]